MSSKYINLTKGWIRTDLENIATVILGRSPPSSTYNKEGRGLPFFQGKADFGEFHPTTRVWCDSPETTAKKNDILISVRAPVGSTNISTKKCCIGRGLSAIRTLDVADQLYVFYHLRYLENYLSFQGTGTTFKAITGKQLKSVKIFLPPLAEQHRIVAKIESIFAQIDAAKAQLERLTTQVGSASGNLTQMKNSVLKQAFAGRLVRQDPKDKSIETLLKRLWRDSETEPVFDKDEFLEKWIRTDLENIATVILGRSPPSSTYNKEGRGLPFFQGKADFGEFHPTTRVWCDAPETTAKKNDILISVRAPVGSTNISTKKCCIGRGLSAIRTLEVADTLYVFYHLRHLENYLSLQGTGTTFKAITGKQLKSVKISLPPLTEQHRIVAKIESIFSKIDAILKFYDNKINLLKNQIIPCHAKLQKSCSV